MAIVSCCEREAKDVDMTRTRTKARDESNGPTESFDFVFCIRLETVNRKKIISKIKSSDGSNERAVELRVRSSGVRLSVVDECVV